MSVGSDNSQQEYTTQCSSFLLFESLFSDQKALKIDLLLSPGLFFSEEDCTPTHAACLKRAPEVWRADKWRRGKFFHLCHTKHHRQNTVNSTGKHQIHREEDSKAKGVEDGKKWIEKDNWEAEKRLHF